LHYDKEKSTEEQEQVSPLQCQEDKTGKHLTSYEIDAQDIPQINQQKCEEVASPRHENKEGNQEDPLTSRQYRSEQYTALLKEADEAITTILKKKDLTFSQNAGKGHCLIFSFLQGIFYPNRVRSNIYSEAAKAMRLVKHSKNIKLMSQDAQERVSTWSDELIEKVF
jgi:hypothetical protein